jgi:eukaryotic-like serine/threonine-protein kinase
MVAEAQMGEPETLEGKVLAGRYRLEHQLGEGGFGTIWRAEQLVLGATVAIKLIDLAIARQAGALDRFLREAQAAATLRSPHVVQVLDYGVDGDQPFIAMELLEGESLAQRLHRLGRLAPSEALRIVTHVARAATRAHECNIVHRDLKPDNVFLVQNEDEEVAKVLDFGVAKIKNPEWIAESSQTRTGSLIGTPHYMSPEQVQGNKAVDYRSDLWSLGVIAFEMFTGQRPFVGNALGDLVLQICVRDMPIPSRLAPVPAGFDDWFAKAADRDPDRRFQSARDLAAALRDVVGGGERDVELVVADDIDPFREVPTQQSASLEGAGAAKPSTAPIELATTILDEPSQPAAAVEQQPATQLESLETMIAESPAREHGLGRIVLVATAAIILVMISINTYYGRRKNGGASRANAVTATVSPRPIAATATGAPPADDIASPQVVQQGNPATQQREPVASSAVASSAVASSAVERSIVVRNVARATPSKRETPSIKPIASVWDWREVVSAMGGSSVGNLLRPATSVDQQPPAVSASSVESANIRPAERIPEPAASVPTLSPTPSGD